MSKKEELDKDTNAKERAAYLRGDVKAKTKEELYDELVETIKDYNLENELDIIEKAYRLADEAHKEQRRKSGEPYIIHPISVAIILTKLEMDIDTIIAGLLHDVIEDTEMEYEDVAREFSEEVAILVDGVTKLTQLNYSSDKVEIQAENLRKMFLAMAKDIRVIIIKLADRLHNMRTLQHMKPEKQKEKSRETLEIYAPLAERLGISRIKVELDDLALKYLEPKIFNELYEDIEKTKGEKEDFISSIVEDVKKNIEESKIQARVRGRVKHYFSIYKKMVNQNKTLDQIYDLFAVRIIVNDVKDCYTALGVIHEIYTPIPGRIKDYIAMPKQNKYQSLHTTVITSDGQQFEVQIRTEEMHRIAEYGIAAHWKYKAGQNGKEYKAAQQEEAKLAWLRQILEWQKDMSDNKEFLTLLKSDLDLFSEWVYCFTPGGDVKTLPTGSTPIDFAYSIHSAIGNKMVGARVNGKLVNIDYQIKNGDRIEIITSQNSRGPSMDWLKLVKSTQAKNKINQWFKTARKEDNIVKGKEMLNVYCKNKGLTLGNLLKNEYLEKTMRKYGFKDLDSLYAAVGHGGLKEGQVINKLLDEYNKEKHRQITDATILESFASKPKALEGVRLPRKLKGNVLVKGMTGVATRMSKCCSPVPGDEIIGFITRGRGVTVHRTDCVNVMNLTQLERERLVETEWVALDGEGDSKDLFTAEIQIYAYNKSGVLLAISKIFTENKVDVKTMNVRTSKNGTATVSVAFDIGGKEQLLGLISKLRNADNVIDIERNRG
ncbi:MAG: bifunctional (p)ppGpp synthetase/guanosine-3',5'-bis(diphosphate) 3'-pyrophosphohydrolase [Lachnospiraceae bacterium]|nr:bifunctional (p)ppGpp synthetase/guanosine-3',5'-bis(diphosphate) 3'-pyrophosphohydrolase [Lachnospiraceae bacterium]